MTIANEVVQFTHTFEMAFSLDSNERDATDVTDDMVIAALERRLAEFRADRANGGGVVGSVWPPIVTSSSNREEGPTMISKETLRLALAAVLPYARSRVEDMQTANPQCALTIKGDAAFTLAQAVHDSAHPGRVEATLAFYRQTVERCSEFEHCGERCDCPPLDNDLGRPPTSVIDGSYVVAGSRRASGMILNIIGQDAPVFRVNGTNTRAAIRPIYRVPSDKMPLCLAIPNVSPLRRKHISHVSREALEIA